MQKRKLEYAVIGGKKVQRYIGDEGWVICEGQ